VQKFFQRYRAASHSTENPRAVQNCFPQYRNDLSREVGGIFFEKGAQEAQSFKRHQIKVFEKKLCREVGSSWTAGIVFPS
jgi:hypothetical protein